MSESSRSYQQPAPRTAEIVTGTLSLLLGLVLAALGAVGVVGVVRGGFRGDEAPAGALVAAGVALALGLMCFVLAWRLLTGRGRKKDGGLLSPTALRLAALPFLALPMGHAVLALLKFGRLRLGEFGISFGAAAAAWTAARYRSSRSPQP